MKLCELENSIWEPGNRTRQFFKIFNVKNGSKFWMNDDESEPLVDQCRFRRQEVTFNGVKMAEEVKFEKIHNKIGSIDEVRTSTRSIGNSVISEVITTRDGVVISDVIDTQLNAFEIYEFDLIWTRMWPYKEDSPTDSLAELHQNLIEYINEENSNRK